jgi:hypothetical protein
LLLERSAPVWEHPATTISKLRRQRINGELRISRFPPPDQSGAVKLIQARVKQEGSIILIPPTSTKMRNPLRFTNASALAYPRVPYQSASADDHVRLESFRESISDRNRR